MNSQDDTPGKNKIPGGGMLHYNSTRQVHTNMIPGQMWIYELVCDHKFIILILKKIMSNKPCILPLLIETDLIHKFHLFLISNKYIPVYLWREMRKSRRYNLLALSEVYTH